MNPPSATRPLLAVLVATVACGGAQAGSPSVLGPPPVVTALDVHGAPPAGGTPVVIDGTGLEPGLEVTFGGTAATAVSLDATAGVVRCITPPKPAGLYDVVVTNPDGQSSTFSGFHYGPPPAPVSFSPGSGPPGTSVIVLGSGMIPGMSGGSEVTVGGAPATITLSVRLGRSADPPIEDTVTVPTLAPGSYEVVVVNPDGQRGVAPGLFVVPGP